jgi:hypothetical protein
MEWIKQERRMVSMHKYSSVRFSPEARTSVPSQHYPYLHVFCQCLVLLSLVSVCLKDYRNGEFTPGHPS